MQLSKIEFYKISKRPELKLLLFIILIPVILTFYISNANVDAQLPFRINGLVSSGNYAMNTLLFGYSFLIIHIIFSLLATGSISNEKTQNHLFLYFPQVNNRKKLYQAKSRTLNSAIIIQAVTYIIFSWLFAKIFMSKSVISNQLFDSNSYIYGLVVIAYIVELMFFTQLVLTTGIFLKPLHNIFLSVGLIIANLFISTVPGLQYFTTKFYLNELMSAGHTGNTNNILIHFGLSMGISVIGLIICNIVGKKYYNKVSY